MVCCVQAISGYGYRTLCRQPGKSLMDDFTAYRIPQQDIRDFTLHFRPLALIQLCYWQPQYAHSSQDMSRIFHIHASYRNSPSPLKISKWVVAALQALPCQETSLPTQKLKASKLLFIKFDILHFQLFFLGLFLLFVKHHFSLRGWMFSWPVCGIILLKELLYMGVLINPSNYSIKSSLADLNCWKWHQGRACNVGVSSSKADHFS